MAYASLRDETRRAETASFSCAVQLSLAGSVQWKSMIPSCPVPGFVLSHSSILGPSLAEAASRRRERNNYACGLGAGLGAGAGCLMIGPGVGVRCGPVTVELILHGRVCVGDVGGMIQEPHMSQGDDDGDWPRSSKLDVHQLQASSQSSQSVSTDPFSIT